MSLPNVHSSGEVDLSISDQSVEVEVLGKYAKLVVTLPKAPAVDDTKASARFLTKSHALVITMPPKPKPGPP